MERSHRNVCQRLSDVRTQTQRLRGIEAVHVQATRTSGRLEFQFFLSPTVIDARALMKHKRH